MKNILLVALPILAALASPLRAADPIQTQWRDLCRVSHGHSLQITTSTGEVVEGVCIAINVDEVSIRTGDNRIVKVARQGYSRILMAANDRHPLRSLGKGMKNRFRDASRDGSVGRGICPVLRARRTERQIRQEPRDRGPLTSKTSSRKTTRVTLRF
jgi:hypothetical protein